MARTRQPVSPRQKRQERAAIAFMLPWFIGAVGITLGPMVASLYLSFTEYNLLTAPQWVGFDNYVAMANDPNVAKSLAVTFSYVLIGTPINLVIALAVAMALNRGLRGLNFYRSVYYLPSLLGGSVAVGVLWRRIFGSDGLVNQFLGLLGIESDTSWVANPDSALWTLILLHAWTFGSAMVIFLAGLRQVPEELHEAASLDGAGATRKFWHVTLPLLTPILFFNLVLGIINSFTTFTQAYIVSGGTGAPAKSTLFYALYLYQQAFGTRHAMGYASALAWLLFLIVGLLTAVNFWASRKWVHYAS
ncbi:carbohydrate ABC transporter permease [Demequina sp. NBRC 110055]|uniref:carbohydrate ABC transporter permease n=1 Tax=Demequina sp. NBRC 110055 TaxID=1570344 RepID=UPI000A0130B9|nr:sugar ABC transporter permease [Demequina sp. NBRC 110055]